MDPELRRAWTEIVPAEDYEEHMRVIGQAQAAAALTQWLVASAGLGDGSRVTVAGAGTGQMLEFLDAGVLRNYRLTFADLNPMYLAQLRERLARYGLEGVVKNDDFEETRLDPGMDLLLATLLLEHIDWRRGVESIARLRPQACGIVMQENPPGMTTAVTPGRRIPPSLAKAMETAHATLVVREELVAAMAGRGFGLWGSAEREVADGKRLVALLFGS
ncbi:MAG: hypothetical protein K0S78_2045 [Thermomicrobiales bacterium]|nr:hypothetical protein [Thermomicrobiales bacterium]